MGHPDERFKVVEHFNGFALVDTQTGEEAWMGDGVDTLFDDEGVALRPGTPGFTFRWECELNGDWAMTLAAYFPKIYDKEVVG